MREIAEWVLATLGSAGVIAFGVYLFRETIAKVFSRIIEDRFEKRMEVFKAELRDKENELDRIMTYLTSARRERDSALQAKRREAAEVLLRCRQQLSQFSVLVEYMKTLNTEEMLKSDDSGKVAEFAEALLKPFKVDEKMQEFSKIDQTLPKLYLSEATMKRYEVYSDIIAGAIMMMKIFTLPIKNRAKILKEGNVGKKICELYPSVKDGFEKFGEQYSYYWAQFFHDDILRSLRHEISGIDDNYRDARSIEELALDSRGAQVKIRNSLQEVGLTDILIDSESSTMAKAAAGTAVS